MSDAGRFWEGEWVIHTIQEQCREFFTLECTWVMKYYRNCDFDKFLAPDMHPNIEC